MGAEIFLIAQTRVTMVWLVAGNLQQFYRSPKTEKVLCVSFSAVLTHPIPEKIVSHGLGSAELCNCLVWEQDRSGVEKKGDFRLSEFLTADFIESEGDQVADLNI